MPAAVATLADHPRDPYTPQRDRLLQRLLHPLTTCKPWGAPCCKTSVHNEPGPPHSCSWPCWVAPASGAITHYPHTCTGQALQLIWPAAKAPPCPTPCTVTPSKGAQPCNASTTSRFPTMDPPQHRPCCSLCSCSVLGSATCLHSSGWRYGRCPVRPWPAQPRPGVSVPVFRIIIILTAVLATVQNCLA